VSLGLDSVSIPEGFSIGVSTRILRGSPTSKHWQ
jgi:hypothetical protein